MSCDNNKGINIKKYVNIAELEPQPITDMEVVLGLDSCKNMLIAEVPPFENLDILINDGDGENALFNDGVYKPVYQKSYIDTNLENINQSLSDIDENKVDFDLYHTEIENLKTSLETKVDNDLYLLAIDDLNSAINNEINNRISNIEELQIQINEKADSETVTSAINDLQEQINQVPDIQEVLEIKEQVETNTSDIQDIRNEIAETEHFRGYFLTTAEILTITNSKSGDYAYNAQDSFKWVFGTAWEQTTVRVPDQMVPKSSTIPMMNGVATVGSESAYAAGNHIHPTDISRASALDFNLHTANINNPHNVTKEQIGLGNVDNTSDLNKPISTLVQQALNNKLNISDAYSKTQIDNYLNLKADKNNVYSKTETDSLLNNKANTTYVDGQIANINDSLATKVSNSQFTNEINSINNEIDNIDNFLIDLNSEVQTKANASDLENFQPKLTAGQNITIVDNVISATGQVSVDETDPIFTAHPAYSITNTNVTDINKIQDIENNLDTKADKNEIPTLTSQLTNDSDFTTKFYVDTLIGDINNILENIIG